MDESRSVSSIGDVGGASDHAASGGTRSRLDGVKTAGSRFTKRSGSRGPEVTNLFSVKGAGYLSDRTTCRGKLFWLLRPDLRVTSGRFVQLGYIAFTTIIAISVITVQFTLLVLNELSSQAQSEFTLDKLHDVVYLRTLILAMHGERQAVVTYSMAPDRSEAEARDVLLLQIKNTWQVVRALPRWPMRVDENAETMAYFSNPTDFDLFIETHRDKIDRSPDRLTSEIAFYSSVIKGLISQQSEIVREAYVKGLWRFITSWYFVTIAQEETEKLKIGIKMKEFDRSPNIVDRGRELMATSGLLAERFLKFSLHFDTRNTLGYTADDCLVCKELVTMAQTAFFEPDFPVDWMNHSLTVLDQAMDQTYTKLESIILGGAEEATWILGQLTQDIAVFVASFAACFLILGSMKSLASYYNEVVSKIEKVKQHRQETDVILYQMLPMQVAENLKLGIQVDPEFFSEATVYFSDVIGFQSLVSQSDPGQIIHLLNELYSSFDKRIELYGCYKVETIGDTYMVVSGIPTRRPDHASEAASLALDLVETAKSIRIGFRGDVSVQIRVGLHSGPCIAGVVGLKMPRYCLFGDTVNTASRMESSSEALKIQCSETTHAALIEYGGYYLELRGTIKIKGKGDMKTYFLNNKDVSALSMAMFGGNNELGTTVVIDAEAVDMEKVAMDENYGVSQGKAGSSDQHNLVNPALEDDEALEINP